MAGSAPVGIAFIGCGYVADMYRACLPAHAGRLRLVGVHDRDPERARAFCEHWGDTHLADLEALLAHPDVSIVLNLTDPHSHAPVTRAALAAGRHVYSEKPLGMDRDEAQTLQELAAQAGLLLAAAPCNLLGEHMQTLAHAVRAGLAGPIRLVYAEIDDGMIHKAPYQNWISASGKPWPGPHEFAIGCTFEHAGYALGPLIALFGPVRRVTAFAALTCPDKDIGEEHGPLAPDFSVGCLEFDHGVVARLTNSIVAPYDHRMRLIGEAGTLEVAEIWDFQAPVVLRRHPRNRLERFAERRFGLTPSKRVRAPGASPFQRVRGMPPMDFLRGVRDMADALVDGRPLRMTADLAVHITEVTQMLQYPEDFPRPAQVRSTCAPILPLEWATP